MALASATDRLTPTMQIQSLLDSGMTEAEVQALFPEIDFSTALEQIASIQTFLNGRSAELPGLTAMFGEALPEEVLTIATDLDMTGAQARWNEFAQNPGAITTDAVIAQYTEDQNTIRVQPQVDAFIAQYTEIPEGASTAELTPEGLIAYVSTYAEATNGADVSGLTPENITAMVSAYQELASGTDVSALKPDEITAYITTYLESEGVDTTGLTPEGITAFVLAYEEVTGGALTTALTPDNITAMVVKYLEAEGVDMSALSPDQVEAIVSSFAEATGCDKSQLLQNFTAYIAQYDDTNAIKPRLSVSVGIYGYDLAAYRKFVAQNPVEVQGIVRLGEVYDDPAQALVDTQARFWKDGVEIPASAVPGDLLTADKVAVLDEDGTLHVLITPEVTGNPEAIESAVAPLAEKSVPVQAFGGFSTHDWGWLNDLVGSDVFERMDWLTLDLSAYAKNVKGTWADWRLIGSNVADYNNRINQEFDPETTAGLQAATRCRPTRKSTPPSGGSAGWPNRKRRCWRSWLRRRTPMSKSIQEALLDLKARQEAGEKMPCPRCGRDTTKPDLHTNALSRHADGIYVCDDCGTAEAMLDFMRNPLPLECWAQFREGEATADFKAVPGEEALKTIKAEHVPRLIRIFQQWKAGTDFKALRITAMKECPGLTQIWEEPFQALYTVADGEIVIRFRENNDAVEVAADHLTKAK